MTHAVVGKSVDGWCARCKLMLAHTIEAVVDDKITRTHCNTCGAQHGYRRTPPGTASATSRGTSPAPRKTAKGPAPAVDYRALLQGVDIGKARPYKMSERFQVKDLIRHPTFGVGLVIAVRDTNKIDVGFNDGVKTLAHGSAG